MSGLCLCGGNKSEFLSIAAADVGETNECNLKECTFDCDSFSWAALVGFYSVIKSNYSALTWDFT